MHHGKANKKNPSPCWRRWIRGPTEQDTRLSWAGRQALGMKPLTEKVRDLEGAAQRGIQCRK